MIDYIRNFISSSRRILAVARKPKRSEYYTMLKTTGLGTILIGVIGYVITLMFSALEKSGII